jgi:hypothetical protein
LPKLYPFFLKKQLTALPHSNSPFGIFFGKVSCQVDKILSIIKVTLKEFLEKLSRVAELAVGDACTGSNPRKIAPPEMEKLLRCCFYDTEVDF